MPTAVQETIHVLEFIVQVAPLGTDLGLLFLLWSMMRGSFLLSRGAIFPALQATGLDEESSRRSWAAFRYGAWSIGKLIAAWRKYVLSEGKWQSHRYEGYRPVPVDWTAFWRPQLKGWKGKMFNRLAQRALPGVAFGVIVDVGEVEEQRIPLLRGILRIEGEDLSEKTLKKKTLQWVAGALAEDEIAVLANFAKRTPLPSIYPRALRGIDAKSGILDSFPSLSYPLCKVQNRNMTFAVTSLVRC